MPRPGRMKPACRQRGEVRHLAAGHEAEAAVSGKPEKILKPGADRLLDDGGGGAGDIQAGVLVPRRGQPVGGDGRRQRAADDKAEVARPGHAHRGPATHVGEALDDGARVLAGLR